MSTMPGDPPPQYPWLFLTRVGPGDPDATQVANRREPKGPDPGPYDSPYASPRDQHAHRVFVFKE